MISMLQDWITTFSNDIKILLLSKQQCCQYAWKFKYHLQIVNPSHYLNQCWDIVNWTLRIKLRWNFNQNTKLFIHKHASEHKHIVFEMAVILSRRRWVLTHWGRDKMVAFSQTTLSNAFYWMKILEFRLKFHWSLFLRVLLTIFRHWFW